MPNPITGWSDGWNTDAGGSRVSFDPRVTQIEGGNYIPSEAPSAYQGDANYGSAVDPSQFRQVGNQWFMPTTAQDKFSDLSGTKANNSGGFFGYNGPFQAFSQTIGVALSAASLAAAGLGAAANAGYAGAADTLANSGYKSLFSSLSSGPAAPVTEGVWNLGGGTGATGGGAGGAVAGSDLTSFDRYLSQVSAPGQSGMLQNMAPGYPGAQTALSNSALGLSPTDAILEGSFTGAGAAGLGGGAAFAPGMSLPGGAGAPGGGGMSIQDVMKFLSGGGASAGAGSLFGGGSNLLGLLSMAQGAYGMYNSSKLRKLIEEQSRIADPNAAYRPGYASRLNQLSMDPSSITSVPGYQSGLQAVQRSMAAQGYQGSGNMMDAVANYGGNFYNQEMNRLAGYSGITQNPATAPAMNISGNIDALNLQGQGLNNFIYGAGRFGR